MISPFHSVVLPVNAAASRALAWPAQDPGTLRTLVLDCTAWLADAGTTIMPSPVVLRDPALSVSNVVCDGHTVSLQVKGGVASTIAVIGFELTLANGDIEDVTVAIPIVALDPALAAGAVVVGGSKALLFAGRPLLFAGRPLTFGSPR